MFSLIEGFHERIADITYRETSVYQTQRLYLLLPGLRTGTSSFFVKLESEISCIELPWNRTLDFQVIQIPFTMEWSKKKNLVAFCLNYECYDDILQPYVHKGHDMKLPLSFREIFRMKELYEFKAEIYLGAVLTGAFAQEATTQDNHHDYKLYQVFVAIATELVL